MKKICSIDGCGLPSRARGWCRNHYDRWKVHGDVLWEPPQQWDRGNERRCKKCQMWKGREEFRKTYDSGKSWIKRTCRLCLPTSTLTTPERKRRKVLRRLAVRKKARLLRCLLQQTDTMELKTMWHGRGRWSMKHSACVECQSTLYVHAGHGMCHRCYRRLTWQAKDKEARKNYSYNSFVGARQEKIRKMDIELLRKAESGLIPVTLKMQNILIN